MIRIKIRKEIDRKKYLLFAILSFVIVLAAWLIASESGAIKEIFLPKPQNVVRYYIESIKDGSLLENTGISIYPVSYTHLRAHETGAVYKRQALYMRFFWVFRLEF